jgi:hypothetical protein
MKSKKNLHTVTIYHQEVTTDYENNTMYFIITEIIEGKPHTTYSYRIPDNYKDGSLRGEVDERYSPYCPN